MIHNSSGGGASSSSEQLVNADPTSPPLPKPEAGYSARGTPRRPLSFF
jgi:hypothetical protein